MGLEIVTDRKHLDVAYAITRHPPFLTNDGVLAVQLGKMVLEAEKPKRILFLADAQGHHTKTSLIDEYESNFADHLKDTQMLSTDFGFTGNSKVLDPRERNFHLDHATKIHKTLGEADYDLIVGRAVICVCSYRGPCGLPNCDAAGAAKFLRRTWKLLRSTNKMAAAYLHGLEGKKQVEEFELWANAARIAVGVKASTEMKAKSSKHDFGTDMHLEFLMDKKLLMCIRVTRVGTGWTIN